jgi:hypothetical protein
MESANSLEAFDQQKALARDCLNPAEGFILFTFHADKSLIPETSGEPGQDGDGAVRIHSCLQPSQFPEALTALQRAGQALVEQAMRASLADAPEELKAMLRSALAEPEQAVVEAKPVERILSDEEIAEFLAQFPSTEGEPAPEEDPLS